jgi:hypothetical protein
MRILNGWKEIAECLNLTSRTAQRWERLGLPVRRVSNSPRSPIIAFSDEIESWVQRKATRLNGADSLGANGHTFEATQRKTRKLARQLKEAGAELEKQIGAIRRQLAMNREGPTNGAWKVPNKES